MSVSRNRAISGAARLVLLVLIAVPAAGSGPSDEVGTRIERVLAATPLIDGHHDLPWELRERFKGDLTKVDLNADTSSLPRPADSVPLKTDIPRLHAGHIGGQFWSVWIPVQLKGPELDLPRSARRSCAR